MTRTTAATRPAHHFEQARRKLLKSLKTTTRHILQRPNRKGDKIFFHYDLGRGKGQRPSTGVSIYAHPKDQIQKNHNKQALALLETKKSQLTIEQQVIGRNYC